MRAFTSWRVTFSRSLIESRSTSPTDPLVVVDDAWRRPRCRARPEPSGRRSRAVVRAPPWRAATTAQPAQPTRSASPAHRESGAWPCHDHCRIGAASAVCPRRPRPRKCWKASPLEVGRHRLGEGHHRRVTRELFGSGRRDELAVTSRDVDHDRAATCAQELDVDDGHRALCQVGNTRVLVCTDSRAGAVIPRLEVNALCVARRG